MSALTILLTIFLAILAYSMVNIGMALEKKGAAELPHIEEQSFLQNIKNFLKNKFWLIGFMLTNIQWVFFLIALEYGSLSLVTPMMGVGLVVLVIFSYFYLKEPISKLEIIGILCIIIGVVILGATNPNEEPFYSLDEMITKLSSLGSIIFFIVSTILASLLVIISIFRKFSFADIAFGFSGGIASGIGVIFSKVFMSGIDFANFGGSFLASVIRWEWWIFLLILAAFNAISMVLPLVGFQRGKAIIVTPIFAILGLITPVIGGIIIFSEWSALSAGYIIAKICALVILVVGVTILSYYSVKQPTLLEEKSSEELLKIQNG